MKVKSMMRNQKLVNLSRDETVVGNDTNNLIRIYQKFTSERKTFSKKKIPTNCKIVNQKDYTDKNMINYKLKMLYQEGEQPKNEKLIERKSKMSLILKKSNYEEPNKPNDLTEKVKNTNSLNRNRSQFIPKLCTEKNEIGSLIISKSIQNESIEDKFSLSKDKQKKLLVSEEKIIKEAKCVYPKIFSYNYQESNNQIETKMLLINSDEKVPFLVNNERNRRDNAIVLHQIIKGPSDIECNKNENTNEINLKRPMNSQQGELNLQNKINSIQNCKIKESEPFLSEKPSQLSNLTENKISDLNIVHKNDSSENLDTLEETCPDKESYSINLPKNFLAKPNLEFSKNYIKALSNTQKNKSEDKLIIFQKEEKSQELFRKQPIHNSVSDFRQTPSKTNVKNHIRSELLIQRTYNQQYIATNLTNPLALTSNYFSKKIQDLLDEQMEIEYSLNLKRKNTKFYKDEIYKMKIKIHYALFLLYKEKLLSRELHFLKNKLLKNILDQI